MSITLGTRLSGRYRLEARVASGGMSTVYRAIDEILERTVAVKLMNREFATDSDQLERFRREARAVAQLSHPHIVGVIDAGDDADPSHPRPYIVLEYVEGETLKELIRREGPLPVPEAIAYAIEIARALGAAHRRHIIHRDVKPQNVLIDEEGSAKVTDFGIARTLEEDGLTADGRVLGTTDYVSPEQALGQAVTPSSDLYSLGIVLYEMLTGDVPFHGDNQVAVAMKHVREEIPDVAEKRPGISAALAQVVDTATAKSVSDRYADDLEMIADLEDALTLETARAGTTRAEEAPVSHQATSVLRTLPPESRATLPLRERYRAWFAVAAIAAVAAVALVILFLARHTHAGKPPPRTSHVVHHRTSTAPHPITICPTCVHDYNPDAIQGSAKIQNPQIVGRAIDGNRSTSWETEIYYDHTLGKPGVGIYVQVSPVAAQSALVATSTPGYSVSIYGTNATPNRDSFTASHWTKLGSSADVHSTEHVPLSTHGKRYRYYLLWITSLGGREQVGVSEFSLTG